jgi:diguanylate cyclase (GGDEF)-like protein
VTMDRNESLLLAVLDDDELERDYVSSVLARHGGIRVLQAANGTELLALLEEHPIDCIVLDYNLGAETGLAIGEHVKRSYRDPPPIVMLTGDGGERTAVKAFRSGFSDYVSKHNLNFTELLNAVRGAVERKSAERLQSAEYERLTRESDYDGLTGLRGRHYIDQLIADLVVRASRRRGTFGLALIRLQEFDEINERFGYAHGERAIRAFATRLREAARDSDICGRYEGGDFAYLVDRDPDLQALVAVRERLSRELSFDINLEAISIKLTAGIGTALYPIDGSTATELLRAAKPALEGTRSTGGGAASKARLLADAPDPASTARNTEATLDQGSAPAPLEQVTNRRGELRQRVLKRGQIVTLGLHSAIDCTIRDVSTKGARIRVDDYFAAPEEFDLTFLTNGTRRRVRTRGQIGKDIGVQFVA